MPTAQEREWIRLASLANRRGRQRPMDTWHLGQTFALVKLLNELRDLHGLPPVTKTQIARMIGRSCGNIEMAQTEDS